MYVQVFIISFYYLFKFNKMVSCFSKTKYIAMRLRSLFYKRQNKSEHCFVTLFVLAALFYIVMINF